MYRLPSTLQSGRFEILGPLASNDGRVWRALDVVAGEERILKAAHEDEPAVLARLEREREALERVRHPNVVALVEVFREDGWSVLVLEACRESLSDRRADGPVDPATATRWGAELLEALGAVHAAGLVHADVAPTNVLLDPFGRVRLADFDEAWPIGDTGPGRGTPGFAAPEQLGGRVLTPRTDLYAVGALLRALVGREVAPELVRFFDRATAPDPEARFGSAADMRAALLVVPPSGRRGAGEAPRSGGRGRWPAAVGVAVAALSVLGVVGEAPWSRPTPSADVRPAPTTDVRLAPTADVWTAPTADVLALPACADQVSDFRVSTRVGPKETLGAAVVDMDGSGLPDVVYVDQLDEGLTVYFDPGGTLGEPVRVHGSRAWGRPAVLDLDRDGRPELAVAAPDHSRVDLWRLREGEWTRTELWQPNVEIPLGADWDGDGQDDLLFRSAAGEPCVAWRRGLGGDAFDPAECLAEKQAFSFVDAGEVRGLLLVRPGELVLIPPGDRGAVGEAQRVIGLPAAWDPGTVDVDTADLDCDGVQEIYLWGLGTQGSLTRLTWTGAEFEGCRVGPAPLSPFLGLTRIADLDLDGRVDFVRSSTCSRCASNHQLGRGVR